MDESTVTERLDSRLAEPLGELTKDELALVTGGIFGGEILIGVIGYWVHDVINEVWHSLQNKICRGRPTTANFPITPALVGTKRMTPLSRLRSRLLRRSTPRQ
jgi:hypothetical protein